MVIYKIYFSLFPFYFKVILSVCMISFPSITNLWSCTKTCRLFQGNPDSSPFLYLPLPWHYLTLLLLLLSHFSHVQLCVTPQMAAHQAPPGKNSGVGCHFLLQCMKVKSEREVAQSCLTLCEPHWLQPTRLLCPWDLPGQSTGVVLIKRNVTLWAQMIEVQAKVKHIYL